MDMHTGVTSKIQHIYMWDHKLWKLDMHGNDKKTLHVNIIKAWHLHENYM